MKRMAALLAAILLCWFALPATAADDYTDCEWVPGRLLVNFAPAVGTLHDADGQEKTLRLGIPSVDELLDRYNVTAMWRVVDDVTLSKLRSTPDFFRLVVVTCPEETDILGMMAAFRANPFVESAEPDLLRPVKERVPNDALWSSQWDKRLMNLPIAWEFATGTRDLICVAVDVGVYWQHDDLYDNLWVNPTEDIDGDGIAYTDTSYPGDYDDVNGLDDDGNGKIDDFIGWDFIRNISGCAAGEDCDSQEDNDARSIDNHGTHVSGLMGAVGNNAIGVAGGCWNVRVIASRAGYVRASDNMGYIVSSSAISCMMWAVAHGASIINMSYGSSQGSSQEANACLAAWNNGALLCAAAGNEGVSSPHYPAAHPHVIAVGSVDNDDQVSDFSNYGTWVDCYAPGNDVMSLSNPGYIGLPGTSMASPNAAGVFALMWSLFPGLTNQQVEDLVLAHCQDITAVNPTYNPTHLGHGRVDAGLVVASQFPMLTVESFATYGDNDEDGRLENGETGYFVFTLHNDAAWHSADNVRVFVSTDDPNLGIAGGSVTLGNIAPGGSLENSNSPVQITVSSSATTAYWTTLTLAITDDNGFALDRTVRVRIGRPQTLLVADDGTDNFHDYFASALLDTNSGYDYDIISTQDAEPILADVSDYDIIVWVCGNESQNTLTAANQSMLAQFLNGGGRLMLAGQNIDEDISGTAFYSDYLHCQSGGSSTERTLDGVVGDPISNGASLFLVGGGCAGNSTSPSVIVPVGGGMGFFTYHTGQGCGAVRFENGTYKTAYYAFALEAACGANSTTRYNTVVRRTMSWFGASLDAPPDPARGVIPAGFALKPNYPNPFNPVTQIAFDLPRAAEVRLRVYDVQGRMVEDMMNGHMPAGSHVVTFDGSRLASGIYLARLEADDFTATQRMVLLK